jgi:cytochrome c oxidase subunit 3
MTARVAHHFDDAQQQFHAATLGMWAFLITEVMFFGGIFGAYAVYRYRFSDAFIAGSSDLHFWAGTINTAVLLLSSLFVALAVNAAASGASRTSAVYLFGAILLGLVFLGVKAFEYAEKFSHHHVPGATFDFEHVPSGATEGQVEIFYGLYFALTGLHAVHMVIGVVLLSVIAIAALRGKFSREYFTPVEVGGLYWHFVDIVWVFLFPLLYLIR